jgi:hypothetical protein
MSKLTIEIEKLESRSRYLNDTIERILTLQQTVNEVVDESEWDKPLSERAERQITKLNGEINSLADRVKPASERYQQEVKEKGFYESNLKKYVGSTFNNALLKGFQVNQQGEVWPITEKGLSLEFVYIDKYFFDHLTGADSIICDMNEVNGIIIKK